MTETADQGEVIAFLSEAHSYGPHVDTVERHETHGAIVFLAGDRAYKLKRAVKFPYMDFSTVERRRQVCEQELTVNRRTAPEFYLDVCPIVRDQGALRLGTRTEGGEPLDWVVVMRRFPQESLLKNLCQAGRLTLPLMRRVAEAVARFHGDAEVVTEFGGERGIRSVIEGNVAQLTAKAGRPFSSERISEYEKAARSALARRAEAVEERRRTGHVRRCHGDLHLNNIFVRDDEPVLFDAIEFNDQFSCIDVLYDLAFLLMDLDQNGARHHANTVFNRYLERSDEHPWLAVMPLFLSCRAAIRAHTTAAKADTCKDATSKRSFLDEASELLNCGIDHLVDRAPRLIAIGGLSGTGKSTLAYALAPLLGACPGAVVIRSDVIRKKLFGVEDTTRLPQSAYTREVSKRVYDRVAEVASLTLASGYTAIADAVFGHDSERDQIAQVAQQRGTSFHGLWLVGPPATLEERIAGRSGDASDATRDILRAQLEFVTVPQTWTHVDAASSAARSLAASRQMLGL